MVLPPGAPLAVPGLLVKVPLPALALEKKDVPAPPYDPLAAEPLLMKLPLPAFELS
jgi:hypothetical protein